MIEQCICAAIITREGTIIHGQSHNDCIASAFRVGLHPQSINISFGFVTTRNRFVGREEGLKIQKDARIESKASGGYKDDILYSADLY